MIMTRRDFGKLALTCVPPLTSSSRVARAQVQVRDNRSLIGGVQFGLQPFCYHDLPMTPENRGTLVRRLVQNGMGMVELHATWVEPRFGGAGVSASDARERLRAWRLSQPRDHYAAVKQE